MSLWGGRGAKGQSDKGRARLSSDHRGGALLSGERALASNIVEWKRGNRIFFKKKPNGKTRAIRDLYYRRQKERIPECGSTSRLCPKRLLFERKNNRGGESNLEEEKLRLQRGQILPGATWGRDRGRKGKSASFS